jgi:hypothetical protein
MQASNGKSPPAAKDTTALFECDKNFSVERG